MHTLTKRLLACGLAVAVASPLYAQRTAGTGTTGTTAAGSSTAGATAGVSPGMGLNATQANRFFGGLNSAALAPAAAAGTTNAAGTVQPNTTTGQGGLTPSGNVAPGIAAPGTAAAGNVTGVPSLANVVPPGTATTTAGGQSANGGIGTLQPGVGVNGPGTGTASMRNGLPANNAALNPNAGVGTTAFSGQQTGANFFSSPAAQTGTPNAAAFFSGVGVPGVGVAIPGNVVPGVNSTINPALSQTNPAAAVNGTFSGQNPGTNGINNANMGAPSVPNAAAPGAVTPGLRTNTPPSGLRTGALPQSPGIPSGGTSGAAGTPGTAGTAARPGGR